MFINDHSKMREIRSKQANIEVRSNGGNKNSNVCISSKVHGGKSQENKLRRKMKSGLKSKVNKQATKNVFDEYYPLKREQNEIVKQNEVSQRERLIEQEEAHLSNDGKMGRMLLDNNDEDMQIKRLIIPRTGIAINFDGKQVKIKRKDTINKNYVSLSQYALTQRQVVRRSNKSKKKLQQKCVQKSKKMNNSKSRPKMLKKQKKLDRDCKSQQHVNNEMNSYKIDEEIQIFGKREKYYDRNERIDLEQIHQLIKEDIENSRQIRVLKQMMGIRKRCVKMMSEICGVLQLRRETFYLSISIFDRVVCKKLNNLNDILLGIVSLSLAMKIQQSKLSHEFIYVLGLTNEHSSQQTYHSESSHQSSFDSKIKIGKKNQFDEIGKTKTKEIFSILKKYQSIPIQKSQFMRMEQKVTVYLRFRLWRIQAIYWADLLTCLWDKLIMRGQKKEENMCLLFRQGGDLKSIGYLYQILELIYIEQSEYRPSIYMVLSTMLILLRIRKQGHEDGYEFYRKSLINSTNILFVDVSGVNQLFWGFLEKLKIQMIDIVGCCQYVSKYLRPELFIEIVNRNRYDKDEKLETHKFNENLYQF